MRDVNLFWIPSEEIAVEVLLLSQDPKGWEGRKTSKSETKCIYTHSSACLQHKSLLLFIPLFLSVCKCVILEVWLFVCTASVSSTVFDSSNRTEVQKVPENAFRGSTPPVWHFIYWCILCISSSHPLFPDAWRQKNYAKCVKWRISICKKTVKTFLSFFADSLNLKNEKGSAGGVETKRHTCQA